jgi:hypothetical protein
MVAGGHLPAHGLRWIGDLRPDHELDEKFRRGSGGGRQSSGKPAVAQKLGGRIEEGWLTSGSINVGTGGSGDANLAVPISGPKGNGTVYVMAHGESRAFGITAR